MVVAWLALWLARYYEQRLEDQALTWVNAITTATDRGELAIVLRQAKRWLLRSEFHLRAYLRADGQLAQWEELYDPKKLPPMTESEAREREPLPPDSCHNVEAREHLRALCMAELARLRQSGYAD